MSAFDKPQGKKVPVTYHAAGCYTDILALSYAIAIIDFGSLKAEEKEAIREYFLESEAPLPPELIGEGCSEDAFAQPVVFALNLDKEDGAAPGCFRFNTSVLAAAETFRLTLLRVFKDNEKRGGTFGSDMHCGA